ncbi:AAA-like domain-containing protein [Epilithonimonas tenax]|uniref:AAA-like domain-containing protein n=1 Tax=Epilithonimonas tenax TaxID=191577 RepID=UPI000412E096|nr:AAA-like domain-containing protein [Epilithonimonas tenax]
MDKILKPYTIIPNELYVQRSADKQLINIISEMGRPGYVLVSRQMGKTNLLLNAKANLEGENDAFVYVDLSNVFDTARSCFENIIDTAIDSFPEKFLEASKKIYSLRKESQELPPHKQHTNELKILLDFIEGKLVIILDEIDALTKTDYSDQIFSQIRSMYFAARVNNKAFNRLTYLLSGVVEPNEIIKDPKVSPFNIGQKIYLNDFTREEFLNFIKISELVLDENSVDRIFYWTNGNPRLTWDVCAEIEEIVKEKECDEKLIDEIVDKLYLKSYDKAPIDNIREIVSNNKQLRDSIVQIKYKNGEKISDELKSKLYLSGIINYESKDVKIKNQIIDEALNLNWIRSLEEKEKGLIKTALDYFEHDNFQETLFYFEKYLEENTFDEEVSSLYHYYMGIAAYRIGQYLKSSTLLDKAVFDVNESSKIYYNLHHIKGIVLYYRNLIDESLDCLKIVIDGKKEDETYVRALLNYGSFSLSSDNQENRDKAQTIFESLLSEEFPEKIRHKKEFTDEVVSVAHYNLGLINNFNDNSEDAKMHYYKALEFNNNARPQILLSLIKLVDDREEKEHLLTRLVKQLFENKIELEDTDPERPLNFSKIDFKDLLILAFKVNEDLFEQILPFSAQIGKGSIAKNIYETVVNYLNDTSDWSTAVDILINLYENKYGFELDNELKFQSLQIIAYAFDLRKSTEYSISYLNLLEERNPTKLENFDFAISASLIYFLGEKKLHSDALKYVEIINNFNSASKDDSSVNFLVIKNLELNIYINQRNNDRALRVAREILQITKDTELTSAKNHIIDAGGINTIINNARSFISQNSLKNLPATTYKKYGRNEWLTVKYNDGRVVNTKYKKIENDIINNECIVVNLP